MLTNAGLVRFGNDTELLDIIVRTLDIIGRLSGSACVHRSPIWVHLITCSLRFATIRFFGGCCLRIRANLLLLLKILTVLRICKSREFHCSEKMWLVYRWATINSTYCLYVSALLFTILFYFVFFCIIFWAQVRILSILIFCQMLERGFCNQ